MGEDEARELARLLLSEKHMGPEIQAFFYAWKGSIKKVPGLAAMAMSFETFADLFRAHRPYLSAAGLARAVDFSFLSLELLDSHFPGQAELFEDLAYFGFDCCCRICGDGH